MRCRSWIQRDHRSFLASDFLFTESFYLFLLEKSIPLSTLWTLARPFELTMMTIGTREHKMSLPRYTKKAKTIKFEKIKYIIQ